MKTKPRKKNARKAMIERTHTCPNCGVTLVDWGHFVPPCMGEPGYWICEKTKRI